MGQAALFADENVHPPRDPRRRVVMSAYATREDNSIVHLQIVNLSYDGCGVVCADELVLGERLSLAVVRRGRAIAMVQWVDGTQAGLSFSAEVVDQSPVKKPRQHERFPVKCGATINRQGKVAAHARVYDMSAEGCRLEGDELPDLNEQLSISFSGVQTVDATAVWIVGQRIGVKFARRLHPVVLDLLTTRFE